MLNFFKRSVLFSCGDGGGQARTGIFGLAGRCSIRLSYAPIASPKKMPDRCNGDRCNVGRRFSAIHLHVVRERGLEPLMVISHRQITSLLRLPISPLPHYPFKKNPVARNTGRLTVWATRDRLGEFYLLLPNFLTLLVASNVSDLISNPLTVPIGEPQHAEHRCENDSHENEPVKRTK